MMIRITNAKYLGGFQVELFFSDGITGVFDGKKLLQRKGTLLEPLRDESFFKRFFVDAGALAWPHGLELSPSRLHQICRHYETA
jgi:hypothetical protein